MKVTKLLMFVSMIAVLLLAGCQSQEDKEKEFRKQTNIYLEKLTKEIDKTDNTSEEELSDYKKTVAKTDKANKKIKKDFKDYKDSFDKDALDNKKNKKIYTGVSNITELYINLYDNLNKISKAKDVDTIKFSKHALNDFYITYFAQANQIDNLQDAKAEKSLNKDVYSHFEDTVLKGYQDLPQVIGSYIMMQGHGQDLDKKDVPKYDMTKYAKYKNNDDTKTVSAKKYNDLADKVNKELDDGSQVPHIHKSVNEFVYKILQGKYDVLKEKERQGY